MNFLPPLKEVPNYKPKNELILQAHFFGQIVGGQDFPTQDALFCQLVLEAGSNWDVILPAGEKFYQTQTCYPAGDGSYVWAHPFDFHFRVKDLAGWPKAILRVWRFNDSSSTAEVLSCGVLSFPRSAGCHYQECPTWTPTGDWKYAALQSFLGTNPRLNNIEKAVTIDDDRSKIFSIGSGKVEVQTNVMLRNFDSYNISK